MVPDASRQAVAPPPKLRWPVVEAIVAIKTPPTAAAAPAGPARAFAMPGSAPAKNPRATSRYSLMTTFAGGPSGHRSSAPPARSSARSTGSSRASGHSAAALRPACRRSCPAAATPPARCGRTAEPRHPGRGRPRTVRPCQASPRRWRTNWSITVSGLSPACSLWNSACTAATRDAVRGPGLRARCPSDRAQERAASICSSAAAAASAPLL